MTYSAIVEALTLIKLRGQVRKIQRDLDEHRDHAYLGVREIENLASQTLAETFINLPGLPDPRPLSEYIQIRRSGCYIILELKPFH